MARKNKQKVDLKFWVLSDVNLHFGNIYLEANKEYVMSEKNVELLKKTRTFKKWLIKISKK